MHAPGAPTDMVMSATAQTVFTVLHVAIAIGVTAWLWRGADRVGDVLVLLGGGLSVLAEPLLDRLGHIWHAEIGQWTAVEMFGHSVPVWMVPVYSWFVGGQTLYVLRRVRAGATARDLWRLYAVFCVMDALLELPILYAGGVYRYFGSQPFFDGSWFPLPGWYIVLNGVLPLAAAGGVLLAGRRRALIPVLMPMSLFAVYAAMAWPTWAALDAGSSTLVADLAGVATIGLALVVVGVLCESALVGQRAARDLRGLVDRQPVHEQRGLGQRHVGSFAQPALHHGAHDGQ